MTEEVIVKDKGGKIELKYDKERYSINYIKESNNVVLSRLSNQKVLAVFSDKIGFIVQVNVASTPNFLVSDYSNFDKFDISKPIKLEHYEDLDDGRLFGNPGFVSIKTLNIDSATLEGCRITERAYLVNGSKQIYNIAKFKNRLSKPFEEIYIDEKVRAYLGDDTVLVTDFVYPNKHADNRLGLHDALTYGINLKTFEITTPIWSELQQRYIEVYTREKINKMTPHLGDWAINNDQCGESTIEFEVLSYLNGLVRQMDCSHRVYSDFDTVNEEFVRSFVRTKKSNQDKK